MEDSLIATRARRANAGSRLKQLIELEEQSNDLQRGVSQIITEDDENVNLLFQEDENDAEFEDEDVDNENLRGIDEDEDDEEEGEEGEGENDDDDDEGESSNKRKMTDETEGDDVLSDSDLSVSDSDESEGEKELEKQEKLKKKAQRKRSAHVPAIKKVKIDNALKKTKPKVITSDSLLLSVRRSSSRAAVVENKQALVEKLQANEKRRAQLTPVVRIKHKDLTQEEKLAEAVETEKANVLSLQEFQEQEVVKKEKQRQSLLSKRKKLTNVVRLVSKEDYVGPDEEISEARRIYYQIKSKKRPGRRRKNQSEEETLKFPGAVDNEIPYMKEELERKRLDEENRSRESSVEPRNDIESSEVDPESKDVSSTSPTIETKNSEPEQSHNILQVKNGEPNVKEEASTTKLASESASEVRNETTEILSNDQDGVPSDTREKTEEEDGSLISEATTESTQKSLQTSHSPTSSSNGPVHGENSEDKQSPAIPEETEPGKEQSFKEEKVDNDPAPQVKEEQNQDSVGPYEAENAEAKSGSVANDKAVHFADDVKDSPSAQPESKGSFGESDEFFEGPEQKITRNMVYLFDFDFDKRLDNTSVKSYLFGPDSVLPASRRFKDLKTILRIGKVINPYAVVKEERDELFEPVSQLTEDDPIFDDLRKLPKLGVAQEFVEDVKEDSDSESQNIVLKTEAPAGIYLPNGNRKICLLSGTEVKYFDPNNGVPYSTVETYKLLKQIEQGQVPWLSVGAEKSGGYPIELYYGSREGMRHAKGVPEGFE